MSAQQSIKRPWLWIVAGAVLLFLLVVVARICLYSLHIGSYNTHPITGLLLVPIVALFAMLAGGLIRFVVSRWFQLSPTLVGSVVLGVWLALPTVAYLSRFWWIAMIVLAVFLPRMLGVSRDRASH